MEFHRKKEHKQQKILLHIYIQLEYKIRKMKSQSQLIEKLSRYGFDPVKETQRSLQERIIQMYELLETRTTQNLLLRKQNDDIKLQINTINELFSNVLNSPQEISFENQSMLLKSCKIDNDEQKKELLNNRPVEKMTSVKAPKGQNIKRDCFSKRYFQSSRNSEQSSVETESKNPRYPPKPVQNIRSTNLAIYDKQQTSRVISPKLINQNSDQNLNDKIELLMRQNEIILKRMNQIEINFINNTQHEGSKILRKGTVDDRSTNVSANVPITTGRKNQSKKENYTMTEYNKTNYSTSNLRSYRPSIQ